MSDAELIARLRASGRHPMMDNNCKVDVFLVNDAADRIESLTEQLTAAQHDAKEAEAYAEDLEKELEETQDRANAFATKEYYTEIRAERAEAKLAKAVETLRFYAWENEIRLPSNGPWGAGSTDFGKVARATLAEIKAT